MNPCSKEFTDFSDPTGFDFSGSFDDQVVNLLQYVSLTRQQVTNLKGLLHDLEMCLNQVWPGCIVLPFGSIVTGLGIQSSDVDCYVQLPHHFKRPGEKYVGIAKRALSRYPILFKEIFAIFSSKIPIVKLYHIPTQRNCDISFRNPFGVSNSNVIGYLLNRDPKARHLAVLIKYWSKVHRLTGTNLFPNYVLLLLIIFYLQHKKIVPPIYQLQQNARKMFIDRWNVAYAKLNRNEVSNESLYKLLGDFFNYYSNFDFSKYIVSPFVGYPIKKETFVELNNVPDCFELYKYNVSTQISTPFKLDTIFCVQDVFEHNSNCSVGVYLKIAQRFKDLVGQASKYYENTTEHTYLQNILKTLPQTQKTKAKKNKKKRKLMGNMHGPNNSSVNPYKTLAKIAMTNRGNRNNCGNFY